MGPNKRPRHPFRGASEAPVEMPAAVRPVVRRPVAAADAAAAAVVLTLTAGVAALKNRVMSAQARCGGAEGKAKAVSDFGGVISLGVS